MYYNNWKIKYDFIQILLLIGVYRNMNLHKQSQFNRIKTFYSSL